MSFHVWREHSTFRLARQKKEKMGAIGLEPQAESSQPLSDVNPLIEVRISNALLPVVESFNS